MSENVKKPESKSSCCRKSSSCSCTEAHVKRDGKTFCCDSCADDAKSGAKCSCGHPACTMK